ncbi:MAG: SET domain-containing protein-lysine N-methyltransferase [Alphaproteobacteria bacterium]|nr:SET domain-containing protein-lysine N-methyltransferase [Alphaproteobacteria bacterium]
MHVIERTNGLHVGPSRLGGRGLFTAGPIAEGTMVTSASVLLIPEADDEHIRASLLDHYVFDWTPDADTTRYAVALGEISFCNHSARPNCLFVLDRGALCIRLYAARDLDAGEELTIDYAYEDFPFEVVEG